MNFFKYQGTGNDFIILDNRLWSHTALTTDRVRFLCDRRFGIGADGLMLLNPHTGYDFEMKYYNADGRESTMCGNGGRCLVKFAYDIGIMKNEYSFIAVDGPHLAEIDTDGTVSLKMRDVKTIEEYRGDFILDTGSPHYVQMVTDVMELDVYHRGMEIRYSSDFAKDGINVNFVEQKRPDEITVLYTGPVTGSFTLGPCGSCEAYSFASSLLPGWEPCGDSGKHYPQHTISLPPGTTYFVHRPKNDSTATPGSDTAKLRYGYLYTECAYTTQSLGSTY